MIEMLGISNVVFHSIYIALNLNLCTFRILQDKVTDPRGDWPLSELTVISERWTDKIISRDRFALKKSVYDVFFSSFNSPALYRTGYCFEYAGCCYCCTGYPAA